MADITTPPPSWRTDPRLFMDTVDGRVEALSIELRDGKTAKTIDADPEQGVYFEIGFDGRPTGVDMIAPIAEPAASKLLIKLLLLCADGEPEATGPRPSVAHLEAIARVFREANERLTADRLLDGWRPTAPAAAAG